MTDEQLANWETDAKRGVEELREILKGKNFDSSNNRILTLIAALRSEREAVKELEARRESRWTKCEVLAAHNCELIELLKKRDNFLKAKARRSSYAWSDGEAYTPNDYINEGQIHCAEEALSLTTEMEGER